MRLAQSLQTEFGVPAPAVSAKILEEWEFPQSIVEAVEFQLDRVGAPGDPLLSSIIFTADRLCQSLGLGPGGLNDYDESWIEEIPADVTERVTTGLGYPDVSYYLLAQLQFLIEVEELVRTTFSL